MSEGRVQVWEIYIVLNLAINVSLTLHRFCIHGVAGMIRHLTHAEMNWTHVSGDILIWACVWMVQLENSTQSNVMLLILPINPGHMHKTAACMISSSPDPEDRPCAVIPVWSRYQIVPKGHSGSFKSVFLGDTENLHLALFSPFLIIPTWCLHLILSSFSSSRSFFLRVYINPLRVPPMMSWCRLTFAVPPVFRFLSPSSYVQHSWEEVKQKQIRSHTPFALPTMIIHMDYTSLPQWERDRERERRRGWRVGEGHVLE